MTAELPDPKLIQRERFLALQRAGRDRAEAVGLQPEQIEALIDNSRRQPRLAEAD